VNRDQYIGDDKEIFPYDATGVVAGRWVESIVRPLFEKYEINVDFSQRGFHDPNVRRRKRKHILLRLLDRIKSLA
jgi:hypothetical protein